MTTTSIPGRGADPGADWAAYTDAAQQIAAILRDEHTRAGQRAAAVRAGQAGVDQLTNRLAAQRQHLTELAAALRLPTPQLGGIATSPVPDPAEALHRAAIIADAADAAAQTAHRLATQPPLLPGLTPLARNVLVYTAAAFLGTLVSGLIYVFYAKTNFGVIPLQLVPWSLCGVPALAFFAGYFTITFFGQPRMGGGGGHSIRVGGAICFIGMPVIWFMFILIAASHG